MCVCDQGSGLVGAGGEYMVALILTTEYTELDEGTEIFHHKGHKGKNVTKVEVRWGRGADAQSVAGGPRASCNHSVIAVRS